MSSVIKFTFLLLIFTASAAAQNNSIKPLAEGASLADTQKWLVAAIGKYASYKTRVNSGSVSNVKFEGCKLSYTSVRKSASSAHDTMGMKSRTATIKNDVAFDLSFVADDGIKLAEHIYPEFQTIVITFRSDQGGDLEIVVKHDAGEPIRAALQHARSLCIPKS